VPHYRRPLDYSARALLLTMYPVVTPQILPWGRKLPGTLLQKLQRIGLFDTRRFGTLCRVTVFVSAYRQVLTSDSPRGGDDGLRVWDL
jgi:hypothetical protein